MAKAALQATANHIHVLLKLTVSKFCSDGLYFVVTMQWHRQDFCEEGQIWKIGHMALTADFKAGCSSCLMTNSFVTNAVGLMIERAVSY